MSHYPALPSHLKLGFGRPKLLKIGFWAYNVTQSRDLGVHCYSKSSFGRKLLLKIGFWAYMLLEMGVWAYSVTHNRVLRIQRYLKSSFGRKMLLKNRVLGVNCCSKSGFALTMFHSKSGLARTMTQNRFFGLLKFEFWA